MVTPQPMSQKNPDFEPLSPIYGQNTDSGARWRYGLCLVTYQGGFGDLAVFGRFGVKNDPKKKVSNCVWGSFGGLFLILPDGLTHFGPSRPQFGSFITLWEGSRGRVACKGGAWGLSRFRAIWGEK